MHVVTSIGLGKLFCIAIILFDYSQKLSLLFQFGVPGDKAFNELNAEVNKVAPGIRRGGFPWHRRNSLKLA